MKAASPFRATFDPSRKGLGMWLRDGEILVMEVLWRIGPSPVHQITKELAPPKRNGRDVSSICSSLYQAGFISRIERRIGGHQVLVYTPTHKNREAFLHACIRYLLYVLFVEFREETRRGVIAVWRSLQGGDPNVAISSLHAGVSQEKEVSPNAR